MTVIQGKRGGQLNVVAELARGTRTKLCGGDGE